VSIDKDVATVLALEEPAKALLEAIRKAQPAIHRLGKAGYAGADWLGQQLWDATKTDGDFGTVALVAGALEMFSDAAGDTSGAATKPWDRVGDHAAFDHAFYVGYLGLTLEEAAETIMDEDALDKAMPRIERLRHYAAAVA
jgi:hypothetical protein